MAKLGLGSLVGLGLLGAAAIVACGTRAEDTEVSAHDLTDAELAVSALRIMGTNAVPAAPGQVGACSFTGCHSINPVTLAGWNEQYKAAVDFLKSDASNDEKIDFFRQNPADPRTGFAPERIGILTAGAHFTPGPTIDEERHPETFKQAKLFAEIFAGKDDLYAEFRRATLMPVLADYPRLTPAQYETVLTFFQKKLPGVENCGTGPDQVRCIFRENRPTKCVDDFTKLAARTSAVKTQTWAAKNFANRMPMIGCPAPNPESPVSPTACFQAKKADGTDVFEKTEWGTDGSTIRVLRNLKSPNSFWLRASADGRFVATGGGSNGGAQALDLQATLDGQSRDIGLRASYDPDFWPDNKAFMFQGGTKFCAQSLLEKPSTTLVSFGEPECSSLSAASGLYQTVGQVVADNSISDRFILYSIWAGDSGAYTAAARDTPPRGGEDSGINIYTAVATGSDVEDGYKIAGAAFKIKTPYRGDTMMSKTGRLLGSRWAYGKDAQGNTPWGYALETLERVRVGDRYEFKLETIGNVCLKGNKANLSFDERFLSTHHYNEPSDFGPDPDPAYLAKGSADVIVIDFITGKKVQVTKMPPGYFALYPHFRSDGWLYFLAVHRETGRYMAVASDWAIRQVEEHPTP
ncbi:MAG: hypothetical protein KIT84_40660 [Labilithrix sp.]|nr:hypothetical protein [Labilithrix sp.]MCW5817381.1 hypothetical protein [Labilithrix sp.]